MVIPKQRDLNEARQRLESWLQQRHEVGGALELGPLERPIDGSSSETLLGEVTWQDNGVRHGERLVFRLEPSGNQLFLGADVFLQSRLMRAIGSSGTVRVPIVRWEEPDPELLGLRFYVMDEMPGRVPANIPTLHRQGWLADLEPSARRCVAINAIAAMAAINPLGAHADVRAAITLDGSGDPLDTYLGWIEKWFAWVAQDRDFPVIQAGLDYARTNQPPQTAGGLVWGDARIGNMMFEADHSVSAVLDWEMATIGPCELDLGYWLAIDRFASEGHGVARLDGMPDRQTTIDLYENAAGTTVQNIEYYEVLGLLRFGIIIARIADQRVADGTLPSNNTLATDNPISQMLAEALGLPAPTVGSDYAIAMRAAVDMDS